MVITYTKISTILFFANVVAFPHCVKLPR